MTTRDTSFPAGSPCWVDLFTSDLQRSEAFYAAVLGWTFRESGEEYGGYTLAFKDGSQVAGLMPNDRASGTPDVWSVYLATDDIEASVGTATKAGARVIAPAMAVGDLGSMAVLLDPSGAAFGLWQAGAHTGFTRYQEPGSVAWTELHSKDFAATREFYVVLSGWGYEITSDTDDFRYLTALVNDEQVAGMMDSASFLPDEVPSHWAVYFGVDDVDAAVETSVELGAVVLRPAEDTPFGRIADLIDPTGAPFKLHGPVVDAAVDDGGAARVGASGQLG